MTPKQNEDSNTTHKELCDQALKHYQEISDKACHFNSIVPKAIEFYKNMPQNLPQECLKSCCKLSYAAGWWAGIESYKAKNVKIMNITRAREEINNSSFDEILKYQFQ